MMIGGLKGGASLCDRPKRGRLSYQAGLKGRQGFPVWPQNLGFSPEATFSTLRP